MLLRVNQETLTKCAENRAKFAEKFTLNQKEVDRWPSRISDVKAFVKHAAEQAGFDLSGVAPAADAPELDHFPAWIAAGHAGEMKYMEARDERGSLKRA